MCDSHHMSKPTSTHQKGHAQCIFNTPHTHKLESDQSFGRVLEGLGGVRSSNSKMVDLPTSERKIVPFSSISKKLVPLTADNFHLVHEPSDYRSTISVGFSEENLRSEMLPVDEKVVWVLGRNGGEPCIVFA